MSRGENNEHIGAGAVELVIKQLHDNQVPDLHTLTMSTKKRFGVSARTARTAVMDWIKHAAANKGDCRR